MVIESDVPLSLNGDPGRLRQIILNLVGNAIKFTDEGDITVSVRRPPQDFEEMPCIEFAVEDTGIGMTPEQMSQLFNPFTQVDGSSTRRFGGTGLGLVISKRLVELMGGSIEVRSKPHCGSCFSFWLPLRTGRASVDCQALWPKEVRDYRVLVVDDVPASLHAAGAALEGLSSRPVMAKSEAALAAALRDREQKWDVVVVDRRLLGTEAMRALGALEKERRMPRLILMGQLTDSAQDRASLNDVDVFLTKPLRRLHLRSAICQLAQAAEHKDSDETSAIQGATNVEPLARLLIAEDNEVNSRLAILMLEKLGYKPDLARDGSEAVDRFASGLYDAVLMDCHMPVMDGYEATRAIRELEASPTWKRPRARIIAMTANAMSGERERCLDAGMDDYMSKPLRSKALMEALSQVVPLTDDPQCGAPMWSAREQKETLQSIRQLAEELSNEAAVELIENWLEDTPARLEEIMRLAGGSDQVLLRRAAHSLKGSSSLFGLNRISELCREIERLAELHITPGQTPLATDLHSVFDLVEPVLKTEMARLKGAPSP